ncbi:hypothetical protein ACI7YV_17510 [Clostridium ljungdahlii]|uniref:hypothetical protein n=1 Tax=Clostridium ljungdahlii TaxID=1538 RepID=UPI00386AA42F
MNIAMILTNGFDPDPRVYKEAKSLTKLGHKITILCWDREGTYIDKPEENLDGIKIVRFLEMPSMEVDISRLLNF